MAQYLIVLKDLGSYFYNYWIHLGLLIEFSLHICKVRYTLFTKCLVYLDSRHFQVVHVFSICLLLPILSLSLVGQSRATNTTTGLLFNKEIFVCSCQTLSHLIFIFHPCLPGAFIRVLLELRSQAWTNPSPWWAVVVKYSCNGALKRVMWSRGWQTFLIAHVWGGLALGLAAAWLLQCGQNSPSTEAPAACLLCCMGKPPTIGCYQSCESTDQIWPIGYRLPTGADPGGVQWYSSFLRAPPPAPDSYCMQSLKPTASSDTSISIQAPVRKTIDFFFSWLFIIDLMPSQLFNPRC